MVAESVDTNQEIPKTENKYCLVGRNCGMVMVGVGQAQWDGARVNKEPDTYAEVKKTRDMIESILPNVFSSTGIPFVVNETIEYEPGSHFFLGPLNLILPIPYKESQAFNRTFDFTFPGHSEMFPGPLVYGNAHNYYSLWLPTSYLCQGEPPPERFSGSRVFTMGDRGFCKTQSSAVVYAGEKTYAYGLAMALKKLERSGSMQGVIERQKKLAEEARERREAQRKRAEQEARRRQIEQALHPGAVPVQNTPDKVGQKPPYRLIKCEREKGSEYAYAFEVELTNVTMDPIQMFGAIQSRFADTIRNMYALSYPSKDPRRLEIEFSDYSLSDGHIRGRAVVLEIMPLSLVYDANTRQGKMSVRLNANQYEEARKWIRRNIETLARDKNIALVTGKIPPAAKFYLGNEELKDGNVLEIEFRTE